MQVPCLQSNGGGADVSFGEALSARVILVSKTWPPIPIYKVWRLVRLSSVPRRVVLAAENIDVICCRWWRVNLLMSTFFKCIVKSLALASALIESNRACTEFLHSKIQSLGITRREPPWSIQNWSDGLSLSAPNVMARMFSGCINKKTGCWSPLSWVLFLPLPLIQTRQVSLKMALEIRVFMSTFRNILSMLCAWPLALFHVTSILSQDVWICMGSSSCSSLFWSTSELDRVSNLGIRGRARNLVQSVHHVEWRTMLFGVVESPSLCTGWRCPERVKADGDRQENGVTQ